MKFGASQISKIISLRVWLLVAVAGAFVLSARPIAGASNNPSARNVAIAAAIKNQPLAFEPYANEAAPEVQFRSRTSGYNIFLGAQQATIVFNGLANKSRQGWPLNSVIAATPTTNLLRLRLLQSKPTGPPTPLDPLPGKANYFTGADQAKWRTEVPLFGKVLYRSVYENVDLVYYGTRGQFEYDFVLHPGGNPNSIRFSVEGASRVSLKAGDLHFRVHELSLVLRRPVAYQLVDGQRRDVVARFVPHRGNSFGITAGGYNAKLPLIIDPVIAYSTYLGGSDDEGIFGIAFDKEGNIYVAGETSSPDFPVSGGVQNKPGGDYDAFVSKFDAAGQNLVYSSYLGGSKYDHAIGIQVDADGRAYIAGITKSADFPVKNAIQKNLGGTANGFIAKLSPTGSQLIFSTYFGGSGFDHIDAFALGRDDAIYITGGTTSLDFPVTPNALQKQCDRGVHTSFCIGDAFVAKLDDDGQKLLFSTYLGGSGFDFAGAIVLGEHGEIYVGGQTGSTDFPTKNPYQNALSGPADAFVSELNEGGSALEFSTFLGGSSFDGATGLALDRHRNIYVTGITASTDFPIAQPFQSANRGGPFDAFITKFNPQASRLIYSTYLGGSGFDYPFRVAVTEGERAAVIGFTSSTDFPIQNAIYPAYLGGNTDAFVFLLDKSGQQPVFSTYFGGGGDDYAYALSLGCRNSIWVGGSTSSKNFPVKRAFQPIYAGGPFDAFLSQLKTHDEHWEHAASRTKSEESSGDCTRVELETE